MVFKTLLKTIGAQNIEPYKNQYGKTSYKFIHKGKEVHATCFPIKEETECYEGTDYYNDGGYPNTRVTGKYKIVFFSPEKKSNKWFIYDDNEKTWTTYKKVNYETKIGIDFRHNMEF